MSSEKTLGSSSSFIISKRSRLTPIHVFSLQAGDSHVKSCDMHECVCTEWWDWPASNINQEVLFAEGVGSNEDGGVRVGREVGEELRACLFLRER